jgi:hypothetical protein
VGGDYKNSEEMRCFIHNKNWTFAYLHPKNSPPPPKKKKLQVLVAAAAVVEAL